MNKKMVVGYCRLSRDDGNDQSTSIINQKKIITKWAQDNGMSIDKWYCDDGYTGINFDRPDMKKLMADLNNNRISTIIVKDYSRIGRKNTKVQEFVENLLLSNVRLISINDGYDSSCCGEDDMLPIKAWMNEIYVKDVSKKVKQSFQSMFEKGNLIINVPYGYIKDPFVKNKYYIDKETARYVPMIFNWYIEGFGVLHIAKKLTDIGAPTATMMMKKRKEDQGLQYNGKVSYNWNSSSVSAILKNDFYIGTLSLGKTKAHRIKEHSKPIDKDEWFTFEDAHEPLIDKNTFKLAQEIAEKRSKHPYRGMRGLSQKYPNVFVGFLECADCGFNMTTTRMRSGETRYICRTYHDHGSAYCKSHAINDSDILEVLIAFLQASRDKLKNTINSLDDIIKKEIKSNGGNIENIKSVEKQLEKANNELEALIMRKVKDTMDNPAMADMLDRTYSKMQKEKLEEIKMLENQITDLKNVARNSVEIQENLTTALSIFDSILSGENITKKQLATILDKIIVYEDGNMDIHLKGNLHKILFPNDEKPMATVKMKKLSRRHKEIFEDLIIYFNDSDHKKVSPTAAMKHMNNRNVGVKYMTVVNLWNQLIEDGSIVKNEGYNAGYSLTKSPGEIADDYLNYKSCLAIPESLNNTDENVNQNMDIETIVNISNWINETFKDINKKTLF